MEIKNYKRISPAKMGWLQLLHCICEAELKSISLLTSSSSAQQLMTAAELYGKSLKYLRSSGRREEMTTLRDMLHMRRHHFTMAEQLITLAKVQNNETINVNAFSDIAEQYCKLAEAVLCVVSDIASCRQRIASIACQALTMALVALRAGEMDLTQPAIGRQIAMLYSQCVPLADSRSLALFNSSIYNFNGAIISIDDLVCRVHRFLAPLPARQVL
jgi:hypothetical protein